MKQHVFKVISVAPVCVDFDDGRSVCYQKGQAFEASPLMPQVARLLRNKQIRAVEAFERVEIDRMVGFTPGQQSQLKARAERKQHLKDQAEIQKKTEIASPLTAKRGDAVPAPKKKS